MLDSSPIHHRPLMAAVTGEWEVTLEVVRP